MFYDRFKDLCKQRGISCNRAASEMGLSSATPTAWKKRGLTPSADTLAIIAKYFGVSVDYLLENSNSVPIDSEGSSEQPDVDLDLSRLEKKLTGLPDVRKMIISAAREEANPSKFIQKITLVLACREIDDLIEYIQADPQKNYPVLSSLSKQELGSSFKMYFEIENAISNID